MKTSRRRLRFPDWFGENWDALEDCLSDLSWREAAGHVLVFDNAKAGDDFGVLVDVLRSARRVLGGARHAVLRRVHRPGRRAAAARSLAPEMKLPLSVLVVVHTAEMEVLLLERRTAGLLAVGHRLARPARRGLRRGGGARGARGNRHRRDASGAPYRWNVAYTFEIYAAMASPLRARRDAQHRASVQPGAREAGAGGARAERAPRFRLAAVARGRAQMLLVVEPRRDPDGRGRAARSGLRRRRRAARAAPRCGGEHRGARVRAVVPGARRRDRRRRSARRAVHARAGVSAPARRPDARRAEGPGGAKRVRRCARSTSGSPSSTPNRACTRSATCPRSTTKRAPPRCAARAIAASGCVCRSRQPAGARIAARGRECAGRLFDRKPLLRALLPDQDPVRVGRTRLAKRGPLRHFSAAATRSANRVRYAPRKRRRCRAAWWPGCLGARRSIRSAIRRFPSASSNGWRDLRADVRGRDRAATTTASARCAGGARGRAGGGCDRARGVRAGGLYALPRPPAAATGVHALVSRAPARAGHSTSWPAAWTAWSGA